MLGKIFLIFKKKKMVNHVSIFHPTPTKTIWTQGWKVEYQFDTIKRLETNFTQMPKVEDQNGI